MVFQVNQAWMVKFYVPISFVFMTNISFHQTTWVVSNYSAVESELLNVDENRKSEMKSCGKVADNESTFNEFMSELAKLESLRFVLWMFELILKAFLVELGLTAFQAKMVNFSNSTVVVY